MPAPYLNIHFPGKLVVGSGCLSALGAEVLSSRPERLMLITIGHLLPELKAFTHTLEQAQVKLLIDTSIEAEPSFADFEALMKKAGPFDPDCVIGIGGGSVLDIAKLVAAQCGNTQTLRDYVGIGLLKGRVKKLVCVPTTSGTGSEMSPNAILVDDAQQKKGIISPYLVPDIVYVDPLLTFSVPASVTAATGLDALTHCMEAYTNLYAQPLTDMYAYRGMQLIAGSLLTAVRDGQNIKAREDMAMGSLLGGACLGPVNTAAVHALSYPLGTLFHLPHGLSNALLLPYVMAFNIPAAPVKYAEVAIALGAKPGHDAEETARAGVQRVKKLIRDCGIPSTLQEVEVPETAIPQLAAEALQIQRLLKNNPRPVSEQDAIAIYKSAYG